MPLTAPDVAESAGRDLPEAAIVVRDLVKRYGPRIAVDGVSFTVQRGEIFALLGPNGAGKTSTIEILEGYRRRDGGEVRVLGLDPGRAGAALRLRAGLMLQEGGVYPQARPREILALFAQFYPDAEDPDALLDLVGLRDAVKTAYRRLSGGQKQRLALALALAGKPELVFLDEPTAGMDPQARRMTWSLIRDLQARGVTILLTTHYMEEAEALAGRVGILHQGRLAALGDLETLRSQQETGVRVRAAVALEPAALAALPGATAARTESTGAVWVATPDPAAYLATLTAWARDSGVLLRELRAGQASLEEIFLALTGEPGVDRLPGP